ncbi:putative ABC transport system permease protein [Fontibacillus solani]|uniref:Putative ABC transport system permease protein n=1 Tax=Fontibacillus solani TaxID=1572857 RepID=A0A7W3SPN7_9BACL|nr:ABC transporter permease [Fontibacillus solani]MBA9083813.1 putative ABC transport system permease protein [Fontibacillus solani]
MKLLNLALANIKKSKSAACSLGLLILISTLLLNIGIGIYTKVDTFYLDKIEESHSPHAIVILNHKEYKQAYEDFFRGDSRVNEVEMEDILYLGNAKMEFGANEVGIGGAFLNADQERNMAPFQLVEGNKVAKDNAIYVPLSMKNGGYELGDSLKFTYLEQEFNYSIEGFYESPTLGTLNAAAMKYFLPDNAYQRMYDEIGEGAGSNLLSIRLDDVEQSTLLMRDFKNETDVQLSAIGSFGNTYDTDMPGMTMASMMMISIISMVLVAFAGIIVIVSLIVIRFRVVNSIDDSMTNIGALGAMGYTSKQIIASMVLQFTCIGMIGAIIGVVLSYVVTPLFSGTLSSMAGLLWQSGFQPSRDLVSFLIIIGLLLIVTLVSSRKIKKLPPVVALRGGILTHSFKRNYFPLSEAKGGLGWVLACKTMATHMKQNIIIGLIIIGVTFASVFAVISYYNFSVDNTAFYNMLGIELSDAAVTAKPTTDIEGLVAQLKAMDSVRKTTKINSATLLMDGIDMATFVSDDYSQMDYLSAYKGRLPIYDNEVVITGVMADKLSKEVGDTIDVKSGDTSGKYLITGLTQTMNNSGKVAYISLSGMKKLNPDYHISTINVYLNHTDRTDEQEYIDQVKAIFGDQIVQVQNLREIGEAQLSNFSSAMNTVVLIVLLVTAVVVSLILYLVIKTMIVKRKRELGVYKAMGYTTYQLMTQIALSFTPVVIVGTTAGGILGCIGTNPLLSILVRSIGISNSQFKVHLPTVMILCIGIVVFSYLISMLVARRIKRITAYGMITE